MIGTTRTALADLDHHLRVGLTLADAADLPLVAVQLAHALALLDGFVGRTTDAQPDADGSA